jgi:hypothetical protein
MKKLIIIVIILIVVGGGAYWYFFSRNKSQAPVLKVGDIGKNGEPIVGLTVTPDNSLYGWLRRGIPVECDITSDSGTIKMMVKNDKVRTEGIPYAFGQNIHGTDGVSLADGDWLYMWSGQQGTKLNIKQMQAGQTADQKAKAVNYSWQDSAKDWQSKYQYNCQEKNLADDLFIAPAGVTFNDMTSTMLDAQKAAADLQKKAGVGKTLNAEDIQAQMEKLKK